MSYPVDDFDDSTTVRKVSPRLAHIMEEERMDPVPEDPDDPEVIKRNIYTATHENAELSLVHLRKSLAHYGIRENAAEWNDLLQHLQEYLKHVEKLQPLERS